MYHPHPETKIGHFHDESTLEIIAPWLEGVEYGVNIELDINTDEIDVIESE